VAVVIALLGYLVLRAPLFAPGESSARDDEEALEPAPPPATGTPLAPRCTTLGEGVRLASGATSGAAIEAAQPAGAGGADDGEDLAPFAAEVAPGTRLATRWALGVKRERGGVTYAEVALLDDAGKLDVVTLGPVRGDLDPPTVRVRGSGWVAALFEPHASGVELKLVTERDKKLRWGAEIEQGSDESLAHDLAFADAGGLVAWDGYRKDDARGEVLVAALDGELGLKGEPSVASSAETDAELPRLVRRPGGYWLAYVARRAESDGGKGGAREKAAGDDGRFRGERIDPSWIEIVPLDAAGGHDGTPRAVTPHDGFVVTFDLAAAGDGGAVIAYRDGDTPSGAHGGRLAMVRISASGATEDQLVARDDVGAGVPTLLEGWLALSDGEGRTRLAPLRASGEVADEPRYEPAIARGQVVAATHDRLLVARLHERAVDLVTVTCPPSLPTPSK
jgi:hypothetical protein